MEDHPENKRAHVTQDDKEKQDGRNTGTVVTQDDKEKQDGYKTVKSQGVGYGVGQGSGTGIGTGIGYGTGSGSGGTGYGYGFGAGGYGGHGEGIGIGYGAGGNGCESGGGNCQNPTCGGSSTCDEFPGIPIQVPDLPRIPITVPVPLPNRPIPIPDEPCPVVPNPPATRCVPCSGNCEPEPPCVYRQMKTDSHQAGESNRDHVTEDVWIAQEPAPSYFALDTLMADSTTS